jgi:hypothetical protein
MELHSVLFSKQFWPGCFVTVQWLSVTATNGGPTRLQLTGQVDEVMQALFVYVCVERAGCICRSGSNQ